VIWRVVKAGVLLTVKIVKNAIQNAMSNVNGVLNACWNMIHAKRIAKKIAI